MFRKMVSLVVLIQYRLSPGTEEAEAAVVPPAAIAVINTRANPTTIGLAIGFQNQDVFHQEPEFCFSSSCIIVLSPFIRASGLTGIDLEVCAVRAAISSKGISSSA